MSGRAARYRNSFRRKRKDNIKIARASGTGSAATIVWDEFKWVRAHVRGYSPSEIVGAVVQGDQEVRMDAEDVEALGFSVPPRHGDRVLMPDERIAFVQSCDANTYRVDGELIVYVCRVRGA